MRLTRDHHTLRSAGYGSGTSAHPQSTFPRGWGPLVVGHLGPMWDVLFVPIRRGGGVGAGGGGGLQQHWLQNQQ